MLKITGEKSRLLLIWIRPEEDSSHEEESE
jgi:hypothetical protein